MATFSEKKYDEAIKEVAKQVVLMSIEDGCTAGEAEDYLADAFVDIKAAIKLVKKEMR